MKHNEAQPQTTRPPSSHSRWLPSEPPEEKAARMAAWQDYRCCRDCRYWTRNDPEEGYDDEGYTAGCAAPGMRVPCGCVITPEDYTCSFFEGL